MPILQFFSTTAKALETSVAQSQEPQKPQSPPLLNSWRQKHGGKSHDRHSRTPAGVLLFVPFSLISAVVNHLLGIIASLLLLTGPMSAVVVAEDALVFKEQLEKANELIKSYRHFEACDALQKAAKLAGDKHPFLHMRLAILYYGLGLIPEAIAEGEKAVALSPSSKWYKYDLAKFYFVNKQRAKAEQQFVALLTQDPGFSLGYYYLAELYFRNKQYDLAWLSLQRAKRLGHQGMHLEKKLARQSKKPFEDFSTQASDTMLFRFIKVASQQEAEEILKELQQGKLFENFELEGRKERSGEIEFGVLDLAEAPESLAASLRGYQLYAEPTVVATGSEYRIVQRIAPFQLEQWRSLLASSPGPDKKPTPQTPAKMVAAGAPPHSPQPTAAMAPATTPNSTDQQRSSKEQEQLTLQLAAYYTLEAWKNAWQAGDIEGYLAAYSDRFIPDNNLSLAAWKNARTASLAKPRFIQLKIENPVVELQPDNSLHITFVQRYTSDRFRDAVRKTLTMAREKGRWRITEERTLEVLDQ